MHVHSVYGDVVHQICAFDAFGYMIKFLVVPHFNSGIDVARVPVSNQIGDRIEERHDAVGNTDTIVLGLATRRTQILTVEKNKLRNTSRSENKPKPSSPFGGKN